MKVLGFGFVQVSAEDVYAALQQAGGVIGHFQIPVWRFRKQVVGSFNKGPLP